MGERRTRRRIRRISVGVMKRKRRKEENREIKIKRKEGCKREMTRG